MPRRSALISQTDLARAIRAVIAAGLPVLRVVARPDSVTMETADTKSITIRREAGDPTTPMVL